jgi:AraC-like DNA-binding protein
MLRLRLALTLLFGNPSGSEARDLAGSVGIDIDRLFDASQTIELERLDQLYEEAARRSGDEDFGLHLGQRCDPGMFSVIAYAVLSAPNLVVGYGRVEPYLRALQAGEGMGLFVEEDSTRFTYEVQVGSAHYCRQRYDLIAAALLRFLRRATGTSLVPRFIAFQHAAPSNVDEYERVFNAPISFEQPRNEMVFDREVAELPFVDADPSLSAALGGYIERTLPTVAAGPSLRQRIYNRVIAQLANGDLDLRDLPRQLGFSARTLQRRLRHEGASLREICDQAKRDLALHYLQQPGILNKELAPMLGYVDLAAFHRAFKRWTGTTPSEYRRRLAG